MNRLFGRTTPQAAAGLHIPLPLPAMGLVLLAAAYCLVGLIGHDPWKPADAIGIGVMHGMFSAGTPQAWVFPRLSGEPYLDDGPLYYALAALCAKLLAFVLAPHDGARLASALSIAVTLWFVRAAGRELFGGADRKTIEGDGAALILMGTLGLFVHAHEVMAANGALAGGAMAWYGLARSRSHALRGALWFGLGLAVCLWSKGPAPLIPPIAAALVAPSLGAAWRTRGHAMLLAIGLGIGVLASLAWYGVLRVQGTELAAAWWDRQAIYTAPSWERVVTQMQTLSWAVWPAWPLAAWAVHDRRHRLSNDPILPVCAGTLAALALFAVSRDVHEVLAMPLMLPLALAAGAGAPALRRGAANALAWFGAMTFTALGVLVWLGWVAMMTGVPQQIARNFSKLEPGYVPRFDSTELGTAVAMTLLWLALVLRSERSLHRSTAFWAGGVTLSWGLAMTLWLPWIDYGKTYRPVAISLAIAVQNSGHANARCISSRGLGEAQRAAFDYHGAITTQRLETRPRKTCPLLLVQADVRDNAAADRIGPGWRRIWEGNRPRDHERFRLYARD